MSSFRQRFYRTAATYDEADGERTVRCRCGNRVYLGYDVNTCDRCGHRYNAFGQPLAPTGSP